MAFIAIIIGLLSIYFSIVIGMMIQCDNYNTLENLPSFWCYIAPVFLPYSIFHLAISKKDIAVLELFLHFGMVTTIFLRCVSDAEYARRARRESITEKNKRKYNRQVRYNIRKSLAIQADILTNAA